METARKNQRASKKDGDAALIKKAVELMQLIEAAEAVEAAKQSVEPKTVAPPPHVKKLIGIPYDEFRKRAEEVLEQRSCSSFNPKDFYVLKERRPVRLILTHRRADNGHPPLYLLEELMLYPARHTEKSFGQQIIIGKLSRQLVADESGLYKNLNCPRYERCVVFADNKGLRSFGCARCPHFRFAGSLTNKPSENTAEAKASPKPESSVDIPQEERGKTGTKKTIPGENWKKARGGVIAQEAERKRLERARELKARQEEKDTKRKAKTPVEAEKSHKLAVIKSRLASRVLSDTKGKGTLLLVERFHLRPEENPNILINLGRLFRMLWTTEAEEHQRRDCPYFIRCLRFANDNGFAALTCCECSVKCYLQLDQNKK